MQKTAVIVLIKQDDKCLVVKHYCRKWDLPGGYVFEEEDLLTALKREVLEETGFIIKNIRLRAIYSNIQPELIRGIGVTKLIFGFVAEFESGEFKINREVVDVEFINKDNVAKYISDQLQFTRFNDLAKDTTEIVYVAYSKNPYYEVVREIVS